MSSLPTGDQHQTVAIQDQLLIQQPDEQQQQQQLYSVPVPDTFAVGGVLDSVAAPTFDEQPFQAQFHAEPQPQAQPVQVLEFHQQPQQQQQQAQVLVATTTTGGSAIGQLQQVQQVYFQPQQQIVQQQPQPQAVVLSQRDPAEMQSLQQPQLQQQQQPQQIVLQQQTVQDAIVTAPVSLAVTTVTEPPMITSKAETAVKSPAPATKPKRATRRKKDPNAPASVSSAYAFFFKDTQASVKTQNPSAKFGEVSKIVAQMWEAMGDEDKSIYKKRNEQDKVRYEREMTEYKERQESQQSLPPIKSNAAASKPATVVKSRPVRAAAAAAAAAAAKSTEASKSDEEDAGPAPLISAPAPPELETTGNVCIRQGCAANAVKSPEWEDEYCSNKCVVAHCRDVFAEWVLAQKAAAV